MWHYGITQSQNYNNDNDDNIMHTNVWFEFFDDLFNVKTHDTWEGNVITRRGFFQKIISKKTKWLFLKPIVVVDIVQFDIKKIWVFEHDLQRFIKTIKGIVNLQVLIGTTLSSKRH